MIVEIICSVLFVATFIIWGWVLYVQNLEQERLILRCLLEDRPFPGESEKEFQATRAEYFNQTSTEKSA